MFETTTYRYSLGLISPKKGELRCFHSTKNDPKDFGSTRKTSSHQNLQFLITPGKNWSFETCFGQVTRSVLHSWNGVSAVEGTCCCYQPRTHQPTPPRLKDLDHWSVRWFFFYSASWCSKLEYWEFHQNLKGFKWQHQSRGSARKDRKFLPLTPSQSIALLSGWGCNNISLTCLKNWSCGSRHTPQ